MYCHGQPPVHGIEAHRRHFGAVTAFKALAFPAGVVTSLSAVRRTTLHPREALVWRPRTESGPQQNSTRVRVCCWLLAGEAGSEDLSSPTPSAAHATPDLSWGRVLPLHISLGLAWAMLATTLDHVCWLEKCFVNTSAHICSVRQCLINTCFFDTTPWRKPRLMRCVRDM